MSSTVEPGDDGHSSAAHVVVVGGGFAGVACAHELGDEGVSVTLIDKNTYHQFQPLLYQVATAQLAPDDVMRPLRGLFRKQPSVAVKQAEVTEVDPVARTVRTASGVSFTGDHLVLAAGLRPNFFGVPGAEEHTFPLYSANDAEALRNRILGLFEDADLDPSRVDRGALTFVIVGGGPTGVETAGALADLVADIMPERYHDLDVGRARICLVDHAATLLRPFSSSAHAYAARALETKGVHLMLESSVTEVAADSVALADGTRIPTHCVVWAGGLEAGSLPGTEALPHGPAGRISVDAAMAVDGFPGVYAVGDLANAADADGEPYPQLGSVALQAGQAAARSILAAVRNESAPDFDYRDKGIMAMIGSGAAIAEVGPRHREVHGSIARGAWLGVHAWLLGPSQARAKTLVSWAWNSLSRTRGAAIVDDPGAPGIDWGDDTDRERGPSSGA